jgi:predicted outer membrane repeat protein
MGGGRRIVAITLAGICSACALVVSLDDLGSSRADASADGGDAGTSADCGADVENDPNNCGFCGHSCAACAQGFCAPSTIFSGNIAGFAVSGGAIYAAVVTTTAGNPGIWSIQPDGSNAKLLAAETAPRSVAVTSTRVYWTTSDTFLLRSAALDGTNITTLATNVNASCLAANAQVVYWTTSANGAYRLASTADGGVTPDAWPPTVQGTAACVVATDAWLVYGLTVASGGVVKITPDGTQASTASVPGTIAGMAINSTTAFFGSYTATPSQTVYASSLDASSATSIATLPFQTLAVVADDVGVYWSLNGNGLSGCDAPGCTQRHDLSDLGFVNVLGLDSQYVYVHSPAANAIQRIPR